VRCALDLPQAGYKRGSFCYPEIWRTGNAFPEGKRQMALYIFNPIIPFRKIQVENYVYDSWYQHCAVSRALINELGDVEIPGKEFISLSSGLETSLPTAVIGLQIGETAIDRIRVYILDSVVKSFAIGKDLIHQVLEQRRSSSQYNPYEDNKTETVFAEKDSPDLFSLELYQLSEPFPSINFELFLKNLRRLHNILLIATEKVPVNSPDAAIEMIENDSLLPAEYKLNISSISHGSVILAL
jgi:hypothetical protein